MQLLPSPVTKDSTYELMRQADLVVATGSQANVRAAYASGTPAFGVGAGNVAAIIDETADLAAAAEMIVRSKTFDNATSCSSENSVVLIDAIYEPALDALKSHGAVLLPADGKARLQQAMWRDGKLSARVIGQSAAAIAERAGLAAVVAQRPKVLMVEEKGVGPEHPFSGEKLSPVLTVYRARDFDDAMQIVERIYAFIGAGHSVGLHTTRRRSRAGAGTAAAGFAGHRQPGALRCDRRQLRQRLAVFAVDGLRHVGTQQLFRQHELPALPEHHARIDHDCRARAVGRRDFRRLLRPSWPRLSCARSAS